MTRRDVTITVPDGDVRAFVFTPDKSEGPWPAVLFYMDGLAIRPAMFEMGERMAALGYFVLLPDMFWRLGPYAPLNPTEVFTDPAKRAELMNRFMPSTDPEKAMRDTGAFLDWLLTQEQVKGTKVGTTGYCMGGALALRAAAHFPDRVVAAGSFHGGNLATDKPDSPHLLADRIRAKVLVAGAVEDHSFDDAQKALLTETFETKGVNGEVTTYDCALHGWVPSDMPTHKPDAAERHWNDLAALLQQTL